MKYIRNHLIIKNNVSNGDGQAIYSGSYLYKPNKDAIDYLNYKIMPLLIK